MSMAPAQSKIKVVRAACDGESQMVKHLQAYDVPPTHEIFTHGTISPVSQKLGITLLLLKVFPSMKMPKVPYRRNGPEGAIKSAQPKYGYTPGDGYFPNEVAGLLMNGDPAWYDSVGSVMIARQDGEPLLAEHVQFLCVFLVEVMLGKGPGGPISQAEQAEMMTPDFLQLYYGEKVQEEAYQWLAGVPSPFVKTDAKQAEATVQEVKMDEDVDMDRGSGY